MAAERYLSRRIPDLRVGNNIDEIDKKLIPSSIHPCLSGPQKRINFSKTPTKTCKTQRKTQLFKESATPESTTPEEIGLKVDFVTGRMCFQVLSDPRFSFLNSFKMILEECTPRN